MFNQFLGEEGVKRVSKWTAISLILLSAFLLVEVISGLKELPNIGKEVYPQSTIIVSGTGEAYAIPDIATFSFSVVETGMTVKQAQEKADTKINKALAAVRESGIEDKDIKTTGYNVYPKYEWSNSVCPNSTSVTGVAIYCPPGKQVLTGYEVNQTITIKVRDTEKVGDLVTKVGAIGVSNISGVEFTVDNRDQYIAEAREQAIIKAKAKAKELAKQLGVRLGSILYYSENGSPIYYGAAGKGGTDMMISSIAPVVAELPTGETKITSDISITYEIK
ncbi:MAG: hypothetical protein A3E02_02550 [Candidatus Zambryskibacteria bacterium RIFCSPHIGHO2_12_FULL_38_34]|uniref:DUF541 domain-containing protein n=1 Tax=Candidatus Zambryskibacteria bacterium RIFCSPLOWO2_12_FULL_39_16 TaxID=1802775 RepID=A0A1G2UTQ9_9BACT|nr:MAG: hypothetical protein A3D37_00100 [Candidatus Zambryskibacteria bacterium RIFCSPHIGHO2_02_FULL_38_22]OHA97669.1 MAG: hypothetical protein A3E02_02550 [Candidatus Zambryskibacteria bacterium RIFCSPHIGHO2_12_FULL_38_34]OHB08704.1 MAG: hypothetical protein A3I19_01370 [Candidatus Zambryskibacteria bacterium RIFCSPLOWO2_02_FULL_38_13]OHB12642.1 MAG: hypothetical protein A3G46_02190 [Candidatus Zambryskibacteria bacterium RIFCSPLOWO2_12_FULL_39_16]